MEFQVVLANIQHVKKLTFKTDLAKNRLMCIVGKNGVGKTTLFRAIKNLQSADTFAKTASPYIFNENSDIEYVIDEKTYKFRYNKKLKTIDTKDIVNKEIKENIYVELPIPHGERFNHFQKLSKIDDALRKCISMQEYSRPDELIKFLSNVYNSKRFDSLKEGSIKGTKYYFFLKENDFYIREDYLSSGEYFVINLYKMIQRKCKLIVIDEIDISLDASAQVNLLCSLREFCKDYEVNIVFTTHSLAIMRKLEDGELHYMDMNADKSEVTLREASYSYVKSLLFGFKGWDKYILTEDKVLKEYLMDLLKQVESPIFFNYTIIYIGGGSQVIDLMRRNEREQFFSTPENVISVLDGDQKGEHSKSDNKKVFFLPFESVEKEFIEYYDRDEDLPRIREEGMVNIKEKKRAKTIYDALIKEKKLSAVQIFSIINNEKREEVDELKEKLLSFLNLPRESES